MGTGIMEKTYSIWLENSIAEKFIAALKIAGIRFETGGEGNGRNISLRCTPQQVAVCNAILDKIYSAQ